MALPQLGGQTILQEISGKHLPIWFISWGQ
jgi:hypothetical protein